MMTAVTKSLSTEDLQKEILHLRTENNHLNEQVTHLNEQVTHLNEQVIHLNEQLEWFKRQIFGSRSERIVSDLDNDQLCFDGFSEMEQTPPSSRIIPEHERRKPNRNGQDKIQLPTDLPVETIILDLPKEEKVCKETGVPLVKIGEETSHKLAHKPGSYYLKKIIRPKYAHPDKEEMGVLTTCMPDTIIPKCRADDSLLAEIIVQKFASHLPLYRIAEILARDGIVISRKLLSQWVIQVGLALKPLYNVMKKRILESKNIFIDETPVKMQNKTQAYMWVVVGGSGSSPPYRFYDFKENRRHENVEAILGDYQGVFHSDKYGAYETFSKRENVIWVPCFAHIRRKFFEAEAGDKKLREWMLAQMGLLFHLEEEAWTKSEHERLVIRQEKEVPIIDEMIDRVKGRLIQGKILPKSKFKQALGYFCSLIPYMKNYTNHPFARLDNNVAERAIRPLAIGRKNWLFFGNKDSGKAASILLSLVQTCRGLGVNPREYLEDIFRRIMSHNSQRLYELLPDEWQKARDHFL